MPVQTSTLLCGVWSDLLQCSNAIIPGPGQDEQARMILSYNSIAPHMIVLIKGGDGMQL